ENDPDDKKIYVTNLTCSQGELLRLLVSRWRIECWHRDAKQQVGFEDFQVRKERAVRNVVLAVLIAYTVLVLSLLHTTLRRVAERVGRPLRTIGELCRFMRLAAMKGWRWVTRMLRERLEEFKAILNREVVVKNAKV
ncbi:MAG: transposase, partial [Nanoarchaeota archaeon]|nr:transposase [Nanoarchaeota archaeon]